MESKKRKRPSNTIDIPNKKVAIEGGNSESIKVHFSSEGDIRPVLVSSPGLTAPKIPFKAYAKPTSTKYTNDVPEPDTHDLLLHSTEHPRIEYTASPIGLDQHLSHYVAVFDPSTKQLQVSPAHHLSLRCSLRSEANEEETNDRRRTYGQQKEELEREFGTKKAKKAIANKFVNAIVKDSKGKGKTDAAQDAVLESMQDSAIDVLKEDEQLKASLASKPIPRPNLETGNVEDVYPFNVLLPQSDSRLVSIKDWQEKAQAEEEMELSHRVPAFRVAATGKSGDTLRLKALRYLNLLLQFHDALQNASRSGKKVPKKDVLQQKLSSWPEPLVDSVRRRFANAQNELPKWHMDNLYTHMCALNLYVDGWTTNISDLRDDVKMENKEILPYFRELGCKISALTETERERLGLKKAQASTTKMAKLRLPLDFPKARSGRRK